MYENWKLFIKSKNKKKKYEAKKKNMKINCSLYGHYKICSVDTEYKLFYYTKNKKHD